jgi:hypothetical protein
MSRSRDIADFVAEITDGTDTVETGYVINGSAKVWVNFDGSTTTPTVRDSFNQASITDLAAGEYTVNFTSNMSDSNYATQVTASSNDLYNRDGVSLACIAMNLTTPLVNAGDVSVMTGLAANGNGSDVSSNVMNLTTFGDLA